MSNNPKMPDHGHGEAGFTLAEVLVALALVALLSSALFGGLKLGLDAWRQVSAHTAATDQNMATQDFLRRIISSAYPMFVMDDPMRGHIDFVGNRERIEFLGMAPAALGLGGRVRFVVGVEHNGNSSDLVVTTQPELSSTAGAEDRRKDVLVSNLRDLEFSYFGADNSGSLDWLTNWNSPTRLPDIVRLQIRFREGDLRDWNELLIAPHIDADVSCVYDTLTRRCRGR